MRTFNKFFYLAVLATGLLMSCNDDEKNVEGFGNNPVNFTSDISSNTVSRASGTQWGVDAIGVYMKKTGQTLETTSVVDDAQNKKYTTTGDGNFVYATPEDIIYFPEDGSQVDFIAYYPYQEDLTAFTYPVNVSDQSNPEEIDLLYSDNAVELSKTSTTAELKFDHMLTNLVLNVTDETGQGVSGMAVTISGMPVKADFSLADGTLTTDATSAQNISAVVEASGNNATVSAILLPVTTSNNAVTFQLSGRTYIWEMEDGISLNGKNRYTFDTNLKSNGTVDVVNPQGTINDWTDNNGGTVDLGDGGDEGGAGTEASPYTVDQLAAKVGETGKWVEGYIVGSTAKTRAVGTPSTENILIAANPDETNEDNCVPVDISNSPVKENLNIVANPELIGAKVKLQGDIVNDTFSNTLSMTNITAQTGGATGGGSGEELSFEETFGPSWRDGTSGTLTDTWATFVARDQFDMKAPIVYSTGSDEVDFRCTNSYDNPHIWFAANRDKFFKIEGIEAGYSNMTLTFDLAANAASATSAGMLVRCNDTDVTVPAETLGSSNIFSTITCTIPDGTTTIEFCTTLESNTIGYRLDNIKITGSR